MQHRLLSLLHTEGHRRCRHPMARRQSKTEAAISDEIMAFQYELSGAGNESMFSDLPYAVTGEKASTIPGVVISLRLGVG